MKSVLLVSLALLTAAVRLSAQPAVPMVPETFRAPGFAPVSAQLELGGEIYAIQDLNGFLSSTEANLNQLGQILTMMPNKDPMLSIVSMRLMMLDWAQIMDSLGLKGSLTYGVSGYRLSDGNFHNRSFLYLPEGYRGVFSMFANPVGSAEAELALAPSGTDIFHTQALHPNALVTTIRDLAEAQLPDIAQLLAIQLAQTPEGYDATYAELLEQLPGRMTLIASIDQDTRHPLAPAGTPLPNVEFAISLQGNAALWHSIISEEIPPIFEETQIGDITVLSLAENEDIPRIIVNSYAYSPADDRIIAASSRAWLMAVLGEGERLRDQPVYAQGASALPLSEASGMTYLSPNTFATIGQLRERLVEMEPMMHMGISLYSTFFPILSVEARDIPSASVSIHRPDGLLTVANWYAPPSPEHPAMGNRQQTVMTVGLIGAMAIPAFNKVREQSREKAITNNLRQIASAGQQYILETGSTHVGYPQLEGEYFRTINPLDGENYRDLIVYEQGGTLTVTTDSELTVSYIY